VAKGGVLSFTTLWMQFKMAADIFIYLLVSHKKEFVLEDSIEG
jgi:hypothetical protein